MKQKFKTILAAMLVVTSVLVLVEIGYQLLPQKKEKTPVILPMPLGTSNTKSDGKNQQSLQIAIKLFQNFNSSEDFIFNITQGNSIKINAVLLSLSNNAEFTVPLYLSIGAFENQRLSQIITSPPSPYPAFPWSGYKDSHSISNPFEANFAPNPLTLEPDESKNATLTITALENARVGKYTMFLEMGDWEQTGLAAVTFQIIINPKK